VSAAGSVWPAGYAATAAGFLDEAADGDAKDMAVRQFAALQGIGWALLAVGEQLADGTDAAADCATRLSGIADAVDGLHQLDDGFLRRLLARLPRGAGGPDMLPYDQIPADRRTILDVTGRLGDEGHNGVLGVALAQWAARDDSKGDPAAVMAANTAVDEIDAMLRELHALRSRLVSEMRADEDLSMARSAELLRRSREERAR
jgi:hypothetical protein